MDLNSAFLGAIIAAVAGIIGALIGFGGSLLAAWFQAKAARDLANHEDKLERKREFDREDREFRRFLQRQAAARNALPLLVPSFDRSSGECLYPFKYKQKTNVFALSGGILQAKEVDRTDWYVSIVVTNQGGGTAVKPIGEITAIERLENGNLVAQPIHGPLRLTWANAARDFDLPVGHKRPLNVVIARDAGKPLEVQLADGATAPVTAACALLTEYVFTIAVTAEGVPPEQTKLRIRWDGTWDGTWPEDRIWVV